MFSERAQANLFYSKNFGDINLRAKASYLYENEEFQSFSSTGNDFGVKEVIKIPALAILFTDRVLFIAPLKNIFRENCRV